MVDLVRLEHFRNLVSLVAADGRIEDVERVALSKIAYQREIPLDRFNVMLKKAHEYHYLIPQNSLQRERQLEEMIELALIDGEFARAELDLIRMVAAKLGVTNEQLDKMIEAYFQKDSRDGK